MTFKTLLVLLTLATAGCASFPPSAFVAAGTPPVSTAPHSAQGMPQTANSLPPGAAVNAPLAARTGNIETTRVW